MGASILELEQMILLYSTLDLRKRIEGSQGSCCRILALEVSSASASCWERGVSGGGNIFGECKTNGLVWSLFRWPFPVAEAEKRRFQWPTRMAGRVGAGLDRSPVHLWGTMFVEHAAQTVASLMRSQLWSAMKHRLDRDYCGH